MPWVQDFCFSSVWVCSKLIKVSSEQQCWSPLSHSNFPFYCLLLEQQRHKSLLHFQYGIAVTSRVAPQIADTKVYLFSTKAQINITYWSHTLVHAGNQTRWEQTNARATCFLTHCTSGSCHSSFSSFSTLLTPISTKTSAICLYPKEWIQLKVDM